MNLVLLIILVLLHLLYVPLNRRKSRYSLKIGLDDLLPLMPKTVWIYTSYYLLIPISIGLLWNTPYISVFLSTHIVSTALASLIWWLLPNGVHRPDIGVLKGRSFKLLRFIYQHDNDSNGLPSGHVANSFISCFYLAIVFHQFWFLFYLLLLGISFSTLTTKQHYFYDMITTLVITPFVIEVVALLYIIYT